MDHGVVSPAPRYAGEHAPEERIQPAGSNDGGSVYTEWDRKPKTEIPVDSALMGCARVVGSERDHEGMRKTIHFQSGETRCKTPPALGVRASDGARRGSSGGSSSCLKSRWLDATTHARTADRPQVQQLPERLLQLCNLGPETLRWDAAKIAAAGARKNRAPRHRRSTARSPGHSLGPGISWNQGTWRRPIAWPSPVAAGTEASVRSCTGTRVRARRWQLRRVRSTLSRQRATRRKRLKQMRRRHARNVGARA